MFDFSMVVFEVSRSDRERVPSSGAGGGVWKGALRSTVSMCPGYSSDMCVRRISHVIYKYIDMDRSEIYFQQDENSFLVLVIPILLLALVWPVLLLPDGGFLESVGSGCR